MNLHDLYLYFGGDLSTTITGDFQTVDGTTLGQQRVLRRLLTNPGDYIFHPEYGAGLPAKVGAIKDAAKIKALIRSQMLLEDAVAKSPPPVITLTDIPNGLSVRIQYTDRLSKKAVTLAFSVDR